jgi:hypothetical protein
MTDLIKTVKVIWTLFLLSKLATWAIVRKKDNINYLKKSFIRISHIPVKNMAAILEEM